MARNLFSSDLVLTAPTPDNVQLGANAPFTLWSERAGGDQLLDCTAPDGVTPLVTDGVTGAFVADGKGQRPALRGPDGVVVMWVDTGSDVRYAIDAVDVKSTMLTDYVNGVIGAGNSVSDEHIRDVAGILMQTGGIIYDDANDSITLPAGSGGGVSDHGALAGLLDDDHPQYLTNARGDVRYYLKAAVDTAVSNAASASSAADRNRSNHTGTQQSSSISDFAQAVQGIVGTGLLTYQSATDAARKTVPAGQLLVIIGDFDPSWMLASDFRWGADGAVSSGGGLGGGTGGASINDTTASTTTAYSSTKTNAVVAAAVQYLLRFDAAQALTTAQKTQAKANLGLAGFTIYDARTAAQGVPTAAQCAAAGYPDGAYFTVDPA